ncbi:MAG: hypothetical protein EOO66_14830 [Methylobacterium sp.]|nr:MAG: hypothetical protein EOO66_14830 [Methylobacterium sp.]
MTGRHALDALERVLRFVDRLLLRACVLVDEACDACAGRRTDPAGADLYDPPAQRAEPLAEEGWDIV